MNFYNDKFEVLTQDGFKNVMCVTKRDTIAFRTSTCVVWETPEIILDHKDSMRCRRIRRTNQEATEVSVMPEENELLLGIKVGMGPIQPYWFKIKEMTENVSGRMYSAISLPKQGSVASPECLSILDRFNIAIQADGSVKKLIKKEDYRATFSFAKEDKIERLGMFIHLLQRQFKDVSYTMNDATVTSFSVATDFQVFKKFPEWVCLNNKSYAWCKEFIREVSYWDSHIADEQLTSFFNKNLEDCKMVQAIATLAGMVTRWYYRPQTGLYTVAMYATKEFTGSRMSAKETLDVTDVWREIRPRIGTAGMIVRLQDGRLCIGK